MITTFKCGRALALAIVLFWAGASIAPAATITFTDQASFLSQVAPGYYEEDFSSLAAGELSVSNMGFSGNGYAYTASVLNTTLWGGDVGSRVLSTANSGVGNILSLNFTSGNVTAVGGNFFYDDEISPTGAGVDVLLTLNDGTSLILALATTSSFGGFISDTPILSLSFDAGGTRRFPSMDNIVAGSNSAVPEPGSMVLVMIGGAAACFLRRRR